MTDVAAARHCLSRLISLSGRDPPSVPCGRTDVDVDMRGRAIHARPQSSSSGRSRSWVGITSPVRSEHARCNPADMAAGRRACGGDTRPCRGPFCGSAVHTGVGRYNRGARFGATRLGDLQTQGFPLPQAQGERDSQRVPLRRRDAARSSRCASSTVSGWISSSVTRGALAVIAALAVTWLRHTASLGEALDVRWTWWIVPAARPADQEFA